MNNTSLSTVILPETLSAFGNSVFVMSTNLKEINIPSGVTVLNKGLFAYCGNTQHITWHDNITSIGNDIFCICEKFASENLNQPAKATPIGMSFFSWTGITSVNLLEGLVSILKKPNRTDFSTWSDYFKEMQNL